VVEAWRWDVVELHGRYLAGGVVKFSDYGGVEFGGCGRCITCLEGEFKYSFEMLVGFGFCRGGNEMQVGIIWRMVKANGVSRMVVLGVSFVKVHEGTMGLLVAVLRRWRFYGDKWRHSGGSGKLGGGRIEVGV